MKSLTSLVLMVVIMSSAQASAESLVERVDINGSSIKISQTEFDGPVLWDWVASTQGWAEVDLGYNFPSHGWKFQPFIGMDVTATKDRIKPSRVYPQFYALTFQPKTHSETWLIYGTSLQHESSLYQGRHLTLTGTKDVRIGAQLDYLKVGNTERFWYGPAIERWRKSGYILLTVQFSTGGATRATISAVRW